MFNSRTGHNEQRTDSYTNDSNRVMFDSRTGNNEQQTNSYTNGSNTIRQVLEGSKEVPDALVVGVCAIALDHYESSRGNVQHAMRNIL